ncbi:hypothetical protein SteCoe_13777 [Stentor coeruleus]|uniref:SANT and BTB domain-containing protein n=1 Tax=Stentor coeruleus TaxID=5963 RepID=A0A1R2C7K3_9CILI|nr:hypothetical protein SteCoe_13777 [Stentor coeruleus]
MFLSSFRRPPSSNNRSTPNRNLPATTVSGTSITRPRPGKQVEIKPQVGTIQRQFPTLSTPTLLDQPKPSTKQQPEEEIIIHVCDEGKKINRDFKCPKNILVAKMKYFESHLQNCQAVEDLEISVHCDVDIFEWLIQYMLGKEKPFLEMNKVISILISSEFLQMQELVTQCLEFVAKNLEEVVKLPIDMNCLNQNLLKQLSKLIIPEILDEVKDRKDKLVSKVYMKKLEDFLEDESNIFTRCVYCNKLYTSAQREWMICEKAQIFIDFHGNVIAQHIPDRNWDMNKFLLFLKEQGLSWRDIYWRIWGRLPYFFCINCNSTFIGSELGHCNFHTQEPRFNSGSNVGYYECCRQKAVRFDTSIKKKGCCAKNHVIKNEAIHSKEYELLLKNFTIIEEPFNPKPDTKNGLEKYVVMFIGNKTGNVEIEVEEDYDEDENEVEEVKESKKVIKSRGKNNEMNPMKQRVWRLDNLRLDDYKKMKEISNNLTKMRKK